MLVGAVDARGWAFVVDPVAMSETSLPRPKTTPPISSDSSPELLAAPSLVLDEADDEADASAYNLSGSSGCRFIADGGRLASAADPGVPLTGEDADDEMSILGGDRTRGVKIWIGAGGPRRVVVDLERSSGSGLPAEEEGPARGEGC